MKKKTKGAGIVPGFKLNELFVTAILGRAGQSRGQPAHALPPYGPQNRPNTLLSAREAWDETCVL